MSKVSQQELQNGIDMINESLDKAQEEAVVDEVDINSVETANMAIETVDQLIKEMFLSDFSKKYFSEFKSDSWNKKTVEERQELYANYCTYLSSVVGEDVLFGGVYYTDTPLNGQSICVMDGKVLIYEKLMDSKNVGISILADLIREIRKYMVIEIVDHIMVVADEKYYKKLKGNAKIYYENRAESWLTYSWTNFYSKEHNKYGSQPIIWDSSKLEVDILFEILKEVYKESKKVDKEMSTLLHMCMSFYSDMASAKAARAEIIKENRENFKLHIKEEEIVSEYLNRVSGDVSLLSDDEFYELFNNSFYSILNSTKFDIVTMLDNLTNELIYRVFKDYDLRGIELPSYSYTFDDENMTMKMSCLYQGEVSEIDVGDSSEIFHQVLHMVSILAQKHAMLNFKDEQEKADYDLMRSWVKSKGEITDPCDIDVVKDELNVIVCKVGELLNELEKKVNDAIKKSKLLNVGYSMLTYHDMVGYEDYNEFKNGYTKKEVQDCLKEYVIMDIEEMEKRKAGR